MGEGRRDRAASSFFLGLHLASDPQQRERQAFSPNANERRLVSRPSSQHSVHINSVTKYYDYPPCTEGETKTER